MNDNQDRDFRGIQSKGQYFFAPDGSLTFYLSDWDANASKSVPQRPFFSTYSDEFEEVILFGFFEGAGYAFSEFDVFAEPDGLILAATSQEIGAKLHLFGAPKDALTLFDITIPLEGRISFDAPEVSFWGDRIGLTYESQTADGTTAELRLIDSGGTQIGETISLESDSVADGLAPGIVELANGKLLAHWAEHLSDGSSQLLFQTYNDDGETEGSFIKVPGSGRFGLVGSSQSAVYADGGFIITWSETSSKGKGAVFFHRFDDDGNPLGGIVRVAKRQAEDPQVAVVGNGGFIIAFTGLDADETGIFARAYDKNGVEFGDVVRANLTQTGPQKNPSLSILDPDGDAVAIIWDGYEPLESEDDVFDPVEVDGNIYGRAFFLPQLGTKRADTFTGTESFDAYLGRAGNDLLSGGGNHDHLNGGFGSDTLRGGDGFDTLLGGRGDDILRGGADGDVLKGSNGADMLLGGEYSDDLFGGNGNDLLRGGANEDELRGDRGDDTLFGGDGYDTLEGGAGRDTLIGGSEYDEFVFSNNFGTDVIRDFVPNTDGTYDDPHGHENGDIIRFLTESREVKSFEAFKRASDDSSGDTVYDYRGDGRNVIILEGVTLDQLTEYAFLFTSSEW